MLLFIGQVKGYFVAVEQEHHECKSYFIEKLLLITKYIVFGVQSV
jgi:hypothetical protein